MARLRQKKWRKSPQHLLFRKPGHLGHFGHFLGGGAKQMMMSKSNPGSVPVARPRFGAKQAIFGLFGHPPFPRKDAPPERKCHLGSGSGLNRRYEANPAVPPMKTPTEMRTEITTGGVAKPSPRFRPCNPRPRREPIPPPRAWLLCRPAFPTWPNREPGRHNAARS